VQYATAVPPADVVWITVKATQLDSALPAFSNETEVSAIVPLLNGIDHVAQLRAKYGAERVIPATIAVESERVAPGHIVHRSPFANLNVAAPGQSILGQTIADLAKVGFTCRFIENEATLLWGKLVFLAPLALVSTATGKVVGEMMSDPTSRQKIFDCVRESCAVALKEGASVDAEKVIAGITNLPPHMRSSMQKDVEQGKAPELDAIAGPILRGAARYGLEVPLTRELVLTIEKKISPVR
jgi:2-dehydropantoate 2-reductase